jgi:cupin 2 domain-containing protein
MSPSVFGNLLKPNAGSPGEETIDALLQNPAFTLEHIVSCGAASPEGFWYDQDHPEWVLLLQGTAELRFDSGDAISLTAGDHLVIPAHCQHRVDHCSPDALWLALHYRE